MSALSARADDARARVRAYMKARGLRMGRSRREALELVLTADGGFTIPELLAAPARPAGVDRATIYRTVRVMADAGALEVVGAVGGVVRYAVRAATSEPSAGAGHVCPRCGFRWDGG